MSGSHAGAATVTVTATPREETRADGGNGNGGCDGPKATAASSSAAPAESLSVQLKRTLQWLYAFTMTRLVSGQLELMRKRLLNVVRFRAFPNAGYTPDQLARAIEPDPDLRYAVALGIFAPLLENWGLGMSIARVVQCLDIDGILHRPDADLIMAALCETEADTLPFLDGFDLAAMRARICINLRTLEDSLRAATHAHPRDVAIDAEPDDDPDCNFLLPNTFPITKSGSAGCVAAPSRAAAPGDNHPQPFYERSPKHPAIRWDAVFTHVHELKRNGPLVGDPGWDDAPPYGKASKKKGQEKWDFKLMSALSVCTANFDDFERLVLRSDVGGPTAKLLALCEPDALVRIIIKPIPALSVSPDFYEDLPASPSERNTNPYQSFGITRVFVSCIPQGPARHFGQASCSAQRSLFTQLYGPCTDFIPVVESSSTSSSKSSTNKADDMDDFLLMPSMCDPRKVSVEQRNSLLRVAQESRDRARANTCLGPLGNIVRNEVMRVVREAATARFSAASAHATGPNADVGEEKVRAGYIFALQSWATLAAELRRQVEADSLATLLRASANASEHAGRPEAVEDGWARSLSNAVDVATRGDWEPEDAGRSGDVAALRAGVSGMVKAMSARTPRPGRSAAAASTGGSCGAAHQLAAYAATLAPPLPMRIPWSLQKSEAGLVGGVLLDPGLELNIAAALLKLGGTGPNADGEVAAAVVRATSNALALIAEQEPKRLRSRGCGGVGGVRGSLRDVDLEDDLAEPGPRLWIDDQSGPAEVLDAVAFWLAGGEETVLELDDFDPGYYGAGYGFASSRIERDVRKAEKRERRKQREAYLKELREGKLASGRASSSGAADGAEEDDEDWESESDDAADEDDGDSSSDRFEWWDPLQDEPAPAAKWALRIRDGTDPETHKRTVHRRFYVRLSRELVQGQLRELLCIQLGLINTKEIGDPYYCRRVLSSVRSNRWPHPDGGEDAKFELIVSEGLIDSVLAPGRKRTQDAWDVLRWKAHVRAGKGKVGVLMAEYKRKKQLEHGTEADTTKPGQAEGPTPGGDKATSAAGASDAKAENAEKGQNGADGQHDSVRVGGKAAGASPAREKVEVDAATGPSTHSLQVLAKLARKEFQLALKIDPADNVPRRELQALDALLADLRIS